MTRSRIIVIGAGLGGLCLAQGLARGGAEVSVYERYASLTARRQGYRLHIDGRAGAALEACLPPKLVDTVRATCGRPSHAFSVLDKRLTVRYRQESSTVDPWTTSVNRSTLREVLATGVDVHWGHELVAYGSRGAEIVARFANGVEVGADVLVGADGVNSAVRRQYLPHTEVTDTGGRIIYGKTLLDAETLALVPGAMRDGFTAIIGGAVGVAAGLVQFREPPAAAGLSPAGDYLMWAVSGQQARFPARVGELDPSGLHQVAARMLRGWHRDLRALVARAEVDETFLIQVRTAEAVPAWPASRVTVLGDAIHAMSPARGSGANTALQDAALLSRTLLGARDCGADLVAAIGSYEEQLRAYGFAAVAASRAAEAATAVRRYPLLRWLAARASKGPVPADPAR